MFGFLKKSSRSEPNAEPAEDTAAQPELEPSQQPEASAPATTAARPSWGDRLRAGLARTRGNLAGMFGLRKIDEELLEDLEATLLMADCGVEATQYLVDELRQRWKRNQLTNADELRDADRKSTRLNSSHVRISYAVF